MLEYTEHFRLYMDLRNQVQQMQDKRYMYLDTDIPCTGAVIMINVGFTQAHSSYL